MSKYAVPFTAPMSPIANAVGGFREGRHAAACKNRGDVHAIGTMWEIIDHFAHRAERADQGARTVRDTAGMEHLARTLGLR